MVAIFITTDTGDTYCMGESWEALKQCMQAVNKNKKFVYINDTETRLRYLSRAWDTIEGVQDNEH